MRDLDGLEAQARTEARDELRQEVMRDLEAYRRLLGELDAACLLVQGTFDRAEHEGIALDETAARLARVIGREVAPGFSMAATRALAAFRLGQYVAPSVHFGESLDCVERLVAR